MPSPLVAGLVALAAAGTVVVGGGGVAGARTDRPGDTPFATASCAELEARVAQVPVLRDRIRATVEDLEGEIAEARTTQRRTRLQVRLQPRIDALVGLDARLVGQVSAVGERCGTG